MKTKLQLIILCLLLFLSGGGSVIHAADPWSYPTSKPDGKFGGGSGSYYDPYLINNAQQLADLAYMVNDGEYYKNKYFKLTTDITLNDNVLNEDGTPNTSGTFQNWTPIGEYGVISDDDFMGRFDGCGHTIRGLYMREVERAYQGLFGSIKSAEIKNLNFEDCLLQADYNGWGNTSIGIVIGTSYESTCMNIHVSKAWVEKLHGKGGKVRLGGIIGRCYQTWEFRKGIDVANSSFNGTIKAQIDRSTSFLGCGGIAGAGTSEGILTDCVSRGDIYVINTYDDVSLQVEVAGLSNCRHIGGVTNCVNYTNIHLHSTTYENNRNDQPKNYYYQICAFTLCTGEPFKNCVNFGNVYIGDDDGKERTLKYLVLYGMRAKVLENCANYGNFIFKGRFDAAPPTMVAGLCAHQMTRCINVQKGNNIPNCGGTTKAMPIIYEQEINYTDLEKKCEDCHYYYNNTNSAGDLFTSSDLPSGVSRHNDLADFTNNRPFFSVGEWGIIKEDGNAYNDYPIPVVCGGVSTAYTGDGKSESTAYIIKTEADLNKLKESVNNGSTFEGQYFKLGSDIYITGALDECIGSYEKPFKGHFDGNGHAIIGLRKSLFGYMYGKVKNLALVDCDIWDGNYATALARQVGDTDNKAEVSNCYVSGTISFSTPWNQLGYASTFAFQLAKGSSIHDCYFKGRFIVKEQTFNTYNVAGIAIYDSNGTVNTSAESPEGIFNCYASFDVKVEASVWHTRYTYGISSESSNDESKGNYFVCSDNGVHQSNQGGIRLNSESELNEKFKDKSAWLQGVYRPVLASAKNYAATTPEATPKTVYFDAIPEANPTPNYFYNISIDDPYSDVSLWSLPNMAVYVPSEKKDYITNGNLVQLADFQYKRSADATATAGQLRYDLTQSEKGYHMVCLPGNVERDDLPEGAKVMIVGKIQTVDDKEQVNVVMVDTIPAGVPCMLYVPTTTVTTGTTIPLVMRSGIVSQPTEDANYSNMKGTFSATTATDACVTAKYSNGETLPVFEKTSGSTSVQPFTAWLAGATGDNVQIVDYVLLDEENEAMTVTLAELNNKQTNLKMRRALKTNNWNTICLPYSLTSDEISTLFGSKTKVEEFSDLVYNSESNTYTLKFTAATEMTAGTPYLIKPATSDVDNIFDIKDKMITCTSETYVPTGKSQNVTTSLGTTSLTMQGEYNHRMISPDEATDGKTLYVISGDKIYYVNSDVEMKGFRCYFVAEESATESTEEGSGTVGTSMFSNARVLHSDGSSTDLRLIKADTTGEGGAVYDLLGRKRDEQTKGIVIENGKKIIIK